MSTPNNGREKLNQNGITPTKARAKRSTMNVSIRKQQRQANISKRRNIDPDPTQRGKTDKVWKLLTTNLQMFLKYLASDDRRKQQQSAYIFRLVLSKKENPPIDEIINTGCVVRVVELLQDPSCEVVIQMELLWILCNIAVGTTHHVQYILSLGALPHIIARVNSDHPSLRSQALWTLANIAGDCPEIRNEVLKGNVIPELKIVRQKHQDVETKRQLSWLVLNLLRGAPTPEWTYLQELITLLDFLIVNDDEQALKDVAWALSFVTNLPDDILRNVITNTGLLTQAVEKIRTVKNEDVIFTLMRSIVNIVSGEGPTVNIALNKGVLVVINDCLYHSAQKIRKQAVWALSNVLAGSKENTNQVLNNNLMQKTLALLKSDALDVKTQAVWCVANALPHLNVNSIFLVLQWGVIEGLCGFLAGTSNEPKVILKGLEALERLLAFGEAHKQNPANLVCLAIEECNGIEVLEILQNHPQEEVYYKALHLLDTFFQGTEATEDSQLQPGVNQTTNTFNFGLQQKQQNTQSFNFNN